MLDLAPPPLIIPPKPAIVRPASVMLTKRQRFGSRKIIWPVFGIIGPMMGQPPIAAGGAFEAAYVTKVTDLANATEYTFSSVSIGDADAARTVFIGFSAESSAGGDVSSMTIGGQAAMLIQSGVSCNGLSCIGYADLPTGTTADVVVALGGVTHVRAQIGIWRVVGGSVQDSDSDAVTPGDTLTAAVDVTDGGFVIACFTHQTPSNELAIANGTERYSDAVEGGCQIMGWDDSISATASGRSYGGTSGTGEMSVAVVSIQPS